MFCHNRKAAPLLSCPGCFYRSIERQQVCLICNADNIFTRIFVNINKIQNACQGILQAVAEICDIRQLACQVACLMGRCFIGFIQLGNGIGQCCKIAFDGIDFIAPLFMLELLLLADFCHLLLLLFRQLLNIMNAVFLCIDMIVNRICHIPASLITAGTAVDGLFFRRIFVHA